MPELNQNRIPHSFTPERKKFYKKHGDFLKTPDGVILFEDGAVDASGQFGGIVLREPPPDDHSRAKLVCKFCEIKASRADAEFNQFKDYLHGTGACPPHIRTQAQKLAHLKELHASAKSAMTKLRDARKASEEATPAWLVAKRRDEAEAKAKQAKFLKEVDSIRL